MSFPNTAAIMRPTGTVLMPLLSLGCAVVEVAACTQFGDSPVGRGVSDGFAVVGVLIALAWPGEHQAPMRIGER